MFDQTSNRPPTAGRHGRCRSRARHHRGPDRVPARTAPCPAAFRLETRNSRLETHCVFAHDTGNPQDRGRISRGGAKEPQRREASRGDSKRRVRPEVSSRPGPAARGRRKAYRACGMVRRGGGILQGHPLLPLRLRPGGRPGRPGPGVEGHGAEGPCRAPRVRIPALGRRARRPGREVPRGAARRIPQARPDGRRGPGATQPRLGDVRQRLPRKRPRNLRPCAGAMARDRRPEGRGLDAQQHGIHAPSVR
jgi:hypothetical protein